MLLKMVCRLGQLLDEPHAYTLGGHGWTGNEMRFDEDAVFPKSCLVLHDAQDDMLWLGHSAASMLDKLIAKTLVP